MDSISDIEIPEDKIYTDKAIWLGTFFGGPLVAGYFLSENFKAFDEKAKARNAIFISVGFTILLMLVIFLMPETSTIPNYAFPLIYSGIVAFLVQHYQGDNIKNHLGLGGETFGGWRVFITAVIGLVLITVPIVAASFALEQPNFQTKQYGNLRHEIVYDADNISVAEVDAIADALTQTEFFGNVQQMSIFGRKEDELMLVATIPLRDNAWEDPYMIANFRRLQSQMQQYVKKGRIVIDLTSEQSLDDVKLRIE